MFIVLQFERDVQGWLKVSDRRFLSERDASRWVKDQIYEGSISLQGMDLYIVRCVGVVEFKDRFLRNGHSRSGVE